MDKVQEAREFLQMVGMPKAQQTDICCYVLLAMAGIKPDMSWSEAENDWIRIHDIFSLSTEIMGQPMQKIVEKLLENRHCIGLELLHW